ncbi:hypothetical protein C8R45DRAFT_308142 [Mycena sanguinolenta]|nr:hypothetical protein C8R45DRAFT_308142 [Mycena sanguinolenta]
MSTLLHLKDQESLARVEALRINDLPTEIIISIFRFVIRDSVQRPIDARLRVTWTCGRWREIAFADSMLWNAICFRAGSNEQAWAWFERAGEAPLDVRIDCDASGGEPEEPVALDSADVRRILVRLLPKLATIRKFIVTTANWENALVVLELLSTFAPSTGVPMLQHFELHRHWERRRPDHLRPLSWPDVISRPFLGGATAPSLEYLTLNAVSIDWSSSVLANLTTLDLRYCPEASHSPDPARFREVLKNCPRLHKLSLNGAGPPFEQSPEPVKLPHLRILLIGTCLHRYAMFLFSQISAPNVNDLVLVDLTGDDTLPMFIQITSAFPKVRMLTMNSIKVDVSPPGLATMRRWLNSMPLLVYLRVACVSIRFFRLFFAPDSDPPVAPQLAVVHFVSMDANAIVGFAEERHRLRVPLEKIYITRVRLDYAQVETLLEFCKVEQLPRGTITPEAEALLL